MIFARAYEIRYTIAFHIFSIPDPHANNDQVPIGTQLIVRLFFCSRC